MLRYPTIVFTLLFIAVAVSLYGGNGSNRVSAPVTVPKTDQDIAIETAQAMGFKNISVLETHSMAIELTAGCSRGDHDGYDLAATNASGQRVKIVACCNSYRRLCSIRLHR